MARRRGRRRRGVGAPWAGPNLLGGIIVGALPLDSGDVGAQTADLGQPVQQLALELHNSPLLLHQQGAA